ncbi:hypothetical protein [Anaeromyxobacter oryzae]|uniref:Lipoprotein n=1 Tax=Anaeromyxobacter oryzae TaxID=2918170 RepID=A0ABN6MQC2_9BACT|nr:hypothetical protein [Anaeromyxobacter oryzae]BDG03207.1 hypothetical protein AMOR_22030 [Anaeromyxobacter oryzae]
MRTILGAMAMAVLAACGGSSHPTATAADVQKYSSLAQGVSTSATSYASTEQATTDVTACRSAHDSYDGHVRPMVNQMQGMSPSLDESLSGMSGHMGDADMGCGADAMKAELDHHAAVACTSTDMAANHAEAARHATAMHDWAEHQVARCGEVEDHMGGGGGGGGTTTGVCQHMSDGSYTLGGQHM